VARLAGKNSLVYLGGQVLSNAADWNLDQKSGMLDVSSLGDDFTRMVRGQRSGSGTISGPLDDSNTIVWDAMSAAVSQPLYIYPNKTNMGSYYYCLVWLDANVSGGISTPVKVSASFTTDGAVSTH
jgi:hypothetical protein